MDEAFILKALQEVGEENVVSVKVKNILIIPLTNVYPNLCLADLKQLICLILPLPGNQKQIYRRTCVIRIYQF